MVIPHYAGRTVAVLGLGKTGLTAARALSMGGARVKCWDDTADRRAEAEAAGFTCVEPTPRSWSDIVACVWSPGIPHTFPKPHPAKAILEAKGIAPVCDIELLLNRCADAFTVAITGTNGKSTTTALIGHILACAGHRVEVGGNLGTPVLELAPLPFHGTYVLEMSSYQLELTPSLSPDVALLLNITPDHLARHGGMDGYVAAKERIFANQWQPAVAVIGQDDKHCRAMTRRVAHACNADVIPVRADGEEPGGIFTLDGVLFDATERGGPREVCDLRTIPALPGAHNWQNACAAYAACRARGVHPQTIVAAMRTFPGLAHRQETVAMIDGVRFVNDSKATNAEAAEKALTCYGAVYWIAGGQAKEGGIDALKPHFKRIRHAFLIGEAAAEFATVLKAEGVPVTMAGTLDEAVPAAAVRAARDDVRDPVVLLSPACASWDQFKSFEHRGDTFRALVARMEARGAAAGGGAA
ncbi:UDP-N-acetylmuramoylalanine--D-glutamate ligase [Caenispirillum salinarum AK4]|uniref:UDP-N-acetylmuramoylalanine--D-glutamate ligase n=1 Tax=Caenispirillum salinarum AK4 TaxID=1238182 RepID=K9GVI4_9PROT|nr:UDP-N-acetylmuramoyl-L-alanine--D-glutamate ligase [Caenispirillum salinarum]EKV29990.1 UDP-N-acetylmuramoylalanine--D-glutamate ligase [Caenispirillum salinarum AK4]